MLLAMNTSLWIQGPGLRTPSGHLVPDADRLDSVQEILECIQLMLENLLNLSGKWDYQKVKDTQIISSLHICVPCTFKIFKIY